LKGRKLKKCISFLGSIGPVFERTTHIEGISLFLKLLRGIGVSKRKLKKVIQGQGILELLCLDERWERGIP
jgi:hypothetical protein